MYEIMITLTARVSLLENEKRAFQLYAGDALTITLRSLHEEKRITASFREAEGSDYAFDERGYPPTPDLFPRVEEIYQDMCGTLQNDELFSVLFQIKRL